MSPAKKKAFKEKMAAGRAKAARNASKASRRPQSGHGSASNMTPAQIKSKMKKIKAHTGFGMGATMGSMFSTPAAPAAVKKVAGGRRAKKVEKAVVKETKKAAATIKKVTKKVVQAAVKDGVYTRAQAENAIKSVASDVERACEARIKAVEKRAMDAFALGNIGRGIRAAHHGGHIPGAPGKAHQETHVTRMKMQHGREMAALRKRAEQAMELGNIGRPFRAAGQAMFQPRPAAMPPPGHRPPHARGKGKRHKARSSHAAPTRHRSPTVSRPSQTMHHEAREKEPNILAGVPGLKGKRGGKASGPLFWVCAGVKRSGCGGGPDGGHVLGDYTTHPAVRLR